MNPLTQIKNTQKATLSEVRQGLSESASWHAKFKHSAYIFAGGLSSDLTEGDVLAVFSQYGEIVDVNLVRHEDTGKSKGFAFICYEDQRSTVLAVDNLNGARVLGRTIRVEHVEDYRLKDEEAAKRKDWRCGCGAENFKFRDNCHKCGGPRPVEEEEAAGEAVAPREDERPRDAEDGAPAERAEAWEGAAFNAVTAVDEDDAMLRELKARKEAAMARARAAAEGLPLPSKALKEAKTEAKRAKKEAKKAKKEAKKAKKEHKKRKREGSRDEDGLGESSSSEEEEGMIK